MVWLIIDRDSRSWLTIVTQDRDRLKIVTAWLTIACWLLICTLTNTLIYWLTYFLILVYDSCSIVSHDRDSRSWLTIVTQDRDSRLWLILDNFFRHAWYAHWPTPLILIWHCQIICLLFVYNTYWYIWPMIVGSWLTIVTQDRDSRLQLIKV